MQSSLCGGDMKSDVKLFSTMLDDLCYTIHAIEDCDVERACTELNKTALSNGGHELYACKLLESGGEYVAGFFVTAELSTYA